MSLTPNHSQDRIIVPRFPGSLTDSNAIIKFSLFIGFVFFNSKIAK